MTVVVPVEMEATGSQLHGTGVGQVQGHVGPSAGSQSVVARRRTSARSPLPGLVDQKLEVPRFPTDTGAGTAGLGFPRWACTCLGEVVVGGSTSMCLSPWFSGEDS